MIEALSVLALFITTLEEKKVPKYVIEVISLLSTLLLWWGYYPGIALYAGVALTVMVGCFDLMGEKIDLRLKFLPLLVLLTTIPVSSLPILSVAILILNRELRGQYTGLVSTLLILVSFLATSNQVQHVHLSIVLVFLSAFMALTHFWRNLFSVGVLWSILACRYSVFVPESLRNGLIALLLIPTLVVIIALWSDDTLESLWRNLKKSGGIAIIVATMSFGEFGLWGMLLAWLALEKFLQLSTDSGKSDNLKVPWMAAAGLFLIPISPIMLFVSSGKAGLELLVLAFFGLLLSLGLWRWIKFAEKHEPDLGLGRQRLIAFFFYVLAIVIGCLFNLKAPLTALFVALGLSTVIIVLFTVLGGDDKLLSRGERSTIKLRLQSYLELLPYRERLANQGENSSSGWELLANFGRSVTLVLTDVESLVHRTLALSVLALVILLVILGGINV